MKIKGVFCACQAGSFAALASVCGKLAASSESAGNIASIGAQGAQHIFGIQQEQLIFNLSVVIRAIGIIGIFLCNAIMWVLFTKSMHLCSSTLEATAFNTASNFIFTAIFGCLIFGDRIGLQWCFGSLLMVFGLIVLHRGSQNETAKASNTSHDNEKKAANVTEQKLKVS